MVAALAKVFEEDDLVAKTIQIDAAVGRLYMFAMKVRIRPAFLVYCLFFALRNLRW